MAYNFLAMILIPIYIAIPAIVLYFVIKFAVKKALRELKEEDL